MILRFGNEDGTITVKDDNLKSTVELELEFVCLIFLLKKIKTK